MSPAPAGDLLLAVNAGSSSLKLAVFPARSAARNALLRVTIDRHAGNAPQPLGDETLLRGISWPADHDSAQCTLALLQAIGERIVAVAHRVVHGGDETRECLPLDARTLATLRDLAPLAPLHQPPALAIIDAIAARFPQLAQFACLDTAFHAGMPSVAREYAWPAAWRARYPELHAYGFHGLSCRAALAHLATADPAGNRSRLVIAHLGSGASITGVRDGRSVVTSMGFSALDGLVMATRPGRVDAGALLYVLRREGGDIDALEAQLYRQAGLLGLSGRSGDMRALLAGDDDASRAAVDAFVFHVVKETGATVAVLGGVDAIVFTGGIGEHQSRIRARIVDSLAWLGARLAADANARGAFRLDDSGSRVALYLVPCDEEAVMADGVRQYTDANGGLPAAPRPV